MATSAPEERLKVLDQNGIFAYWADDAEYKRLIHMGFGRSFGTRRKVHGVKLVVPLNVAADRSDVKTGRSLNLALYLGTRYSYRERLATGGSVHVLRKITHLGEILFRKPVIDCLVIVKKDKDGPAGEQS